MHPFFFKDVLIFWRSRRELLVSLIVPIILIVLLGFTLPSWVENKSDLQQMAVALVNEDDEAGAVHQLRQHEPQSAALLEGLQTADLPIEMFMKLFSQAEIQSMVNILETDRETAFQALQDEAVEAVITIPEGFTYAVLQRMLLHNGDGATIELSADNVSLRVNTLQDILGSFARELNLQSAISYALASSSAHAVTIANPEQMESIGGNEAIDTFPMITSFQYFALALSIMFALMISLSAAGKAAVELRGHVIHRIILSGVHPVRYLAGKLGSTFIVSWLQFTTVVLITHLLLNVFPDRSLTFWLGIAFIAAFLSLSVAALTGLCTALLFRVNENIVTSLFTLILMVFSVIGGNVVPLYALPELLQRAGEWTPNGQLLAVFMQWVRQEDMAVLFSALFKVAISALAMLVLAVWLFPRRGKI
ncbi:ABC transporter permease [Paenibacillaceae bacterium]|nr:ABC transporter permease [Paenibacillaceae bacterium]